MNLKREAGEAAAGLVEDGMVLGLGTGSTVRYTLDRLGKLVADGLDIVGVPTSTSTEKLALSLRIPLTSLEEHPELDLTIDGADEVSPSLDVIKGLGGALVREKIVAASSRRLIVVVDESKLVDRLGTKSPLPVEVVRFGSEATKARLAALGCDPAWRVAGGERLVSDNGNYILDCRMDGIDDPPALEARINSIPGVVENGLFLGMAEAAYVGTPQGVRVLQRPTP
jgi:ribose 5-phosphate isomerase A